MRSTRLPVVLGSRYGPLLIIQSAANLLLAVWLYLEYTHNPFMQAYVSNVWASIWTEVTAGISVVIVAVVIFAFYRSRQANSIAGRLGSKSMLHELEGASNLARLDACPFCETPLKPISEGRLQCRKCRRYFKSGLPKSAA
jgi:ribosomal protein L37AE/L43A